ncbi:hypothetical protein QBC43DRAFT_219820 [Cladorrhinum sp. PSN259]|nr:hypothetical protein QBC43DRAFT_219820 [Cladorrhinum sp. PSN259]
MPTDVGKLYPLGEKLCGGEEPYPQYDKSLVIQNPADTSLVQLLLRIKSTTGNSGLGRTFFPLGSVEQIITPHIVTEEITKGRDLLAKPLTDEHIHDYAQRVCFKGEQSLCRIFAILAMLQRPWEVVNFIDERISDIDLPLKTVTPSTNYMVRLQNPRTHGTLCSLGAFSHEQFQHLQWTMVPASFPKDTPHLRFDRRQAMPWSEEWYFNERYKSYAYLSRVRIHDAHHFFEHPYLLDGIFALKTFTSYHGSSSSSAIEELEAKADEVHSPSSLQTRQHFDRELKWLQGVAKFNHPHLRPFFAAYEHGDQSCLLFPWADAHLKLLWNNTTAGPPLERPSLMWLVKQFRGLADALQIFYTSVRNLDSHDRLPEIQGGISAYHILGYRDPNRADCATNATAYTLVLSGFDNSMPSETYQPPERNTQGNKASASDDVWSLGCIMLETIAWFVGGGEYVGKLLHCRKKPDVLNGGVLSAKFYSYVREPEARGDGPIFARVDVGVHDVSGFYSDTSPVLR